MRILWLKNNVGFIQILGGNVITRYLVVYVITRKQNADSMIILTLVP